MRRVSYLVAPLLMLVSVFGMLAPAAGADPGPAPTPTPTQLHQAAVKAADGFCGSGPLGLAITAAQAGGTCRKKLAARLEADGGPRNIEAEGCNVFADMVPSLLAFDRPLVRTACKGLGSLSDSLGGLWDSALKAVMSVPGLGTALKIAQFVADPSSEFEKFVNEVHQDAVSLVTSVLGDAGSAGEWDMRSGGYLQRYASAAAIGLVLMAFLFVSALREAADRGDRREGERLLRGLATGFVTILFAPAVIYVLNNGSVLAASGFKGSVVNPSLSSAVDRLGALGAVTSVAVPGGAVVGLILFSLMVAGGVGLFIGNLVNQYGLEVAAIAIAILAATRVHPRWEDRGKKAALTVLGLLMVRPLVMLLVGWCCGLIDDSLDPSRLSGGGMQALTGLGSAAVAVMSLGLAPFALLKWLPLSPTRPASHDTSGGGHGIAGPVLGAVTGAALGGWRAREGVNSRGSGPSRAGEGSSSFLGSRGGGAGTAGGGGGPGGEQPSGGGAAPRPGGLNFIGSAGSAGKTAGGGGAGSAAGAGGKAASVGGKAAAGGMSAGAAFAADCLRQIGQSGVAKARHVAQDQGVEVEHDLGTGGGGGS